MTIATSIACSPSSSPAATTAPLESTVPPIHAPPISWFNPIALMSGGIITNIRTVKISDMDMVSVRCSLRALLAAAMAIAADTPHTLVALAMSSAKLFGMFQRSAPRR